MEMLPAPLPALPQIIGQLKRLVLDSVGSRESKRAYGRGLDHFLNWYQAAQPSTGFTKATVQSYRAHLLESGLSSKTSQIRLVII